MGSVSPAATRTLTLTCTLTLTLTCTLTLTLTLTPTLSLVQGRYSGEKDTPCRATYVLKWFAVITQKGKLD